MVAGFKLTTYTLCCLLLSLLSALAGCSTTHHPLTQQVLSSGINFDGIPGSVNEFDTYAESPNHKAFAVSMGDDGVVHAWSKA